MMEQEVVDYISQAQKHGLSDFEIKQNLLNAGWEAAVVEDSLVFAKAAENKSSPSQPAPKPFSISPLPAQPFQPVQQPAVLQSIAPKPDAVQPMTPAQGSVVLSDQHFEKNGAQPIYKKPLVWAIIVAIIIIGTGGAYAYAAFFSATPAKVINKFLTTPKAKTFSTAYSISYTDTSAASSTGNIGLSLNGTLNSDLTDLNNLKQQNNINASLTYDVVNFGVNFKYLVLGQVIYFDIGQIPQLKQFLPDQNIEWVKVDLNEIKKQQDQTESQVFNQMSFSPALQNQLKDIWSKTNVLKSTNFFAKETLNGVPTYHLKEQFDNQAFGAALISSIQDIAAESTSTAGSLTDSDKQLITALINKVQVKELDLWIGQKDSEIYKFHLLVSVPSVKDLSDPSLADASPVLSQARGKSRDAKRFADVSQLASAFELYYNDYGGYPAAGSNGQPQNLTPTYIEAWPTAPTPLDGTCTNYYNTYWYTPIGAPYIKNGVTVYPSYKLTFCLGALTGSYQAGIGELSPTGIKGNIACPTTADKCVNSSGPSDQNAQILDAVNKMTFGASLKIDATYSDYGKAQNITAPTSSMDIMDLIKQASGEPTPVQNNDPAIKTN